MYNKLTMAFPLFRRETAEVSHRTNWYAFVRLLFLIAIALPGLVSLYVFHGWSSEVLRDIILFMVALASNALFYGLVIIHQNTTYQRTLAGIWIGLDILLITFLIYANGGIESRLIILYAVPILMAAAILGRLATYIAAATSSFMYIGLIIGDYLGIISSVGRLNDNLHTDLAYVVNTICFFPSVMIVIALAIDFITKLLIAKEHEANQSIAELKRAQEIARLGSWEWNIRTNEITWSEGLTKILHIHHVRPPLSYEQYMQFVHPDDRETHHKIISTALKKKKPFTLDYRIVMPDGSVKYVHSDGEIITARSGSITRIVGTTQDVTDARHLDDTKSEFVSLASHQLRTPASTVKTYVSLLIDGFAGKLTRKQLAFAKKANDANERQLDIIDSLLSLASIESGRLVLHKQAINLNDVLRQCLPEHRLEARKKKQKFSSDLSRKPIFVNADATYIRMAVDNLISNAIKYTPEKGMIKITTRSTSFSAFCEVTDSGIGIPKSSLPALFQKFSRLSDPASKTVDGSGLGLYLAKYIINQHHGSISVHSHSGQGAQFRIRVPRIRNLSRTLLGKNRKNIKKA